MQSKVNESARPVHELTTNKQWLDLAWNAKRLF
jgi:hypothetical protein